MIASLPMYDLPEVRPALDAFWAALADALSQAGIAGAPQELTRGAHAGATWCDRDLLFSQCCGYDLTKRFAGMLQPVATPRYDAPGCAGHDYCSFVVVRGDAGFEDIADLRGRVFALNGHESHSGMNAMRALVATHAHQGRFFETVVTTGAHDKSIEAVVSGTADAAAIDCVTHALLARHRPAALSGTRVLTSTAPAPALPFVTRIERSAEDVSRILAALTHTIALRSLASVCADLLLEGVEALPLHAYAPIGAMEAAAKAAGYPILA